MLIASLLIIIVNFLANHQALLFYFRHDDFPVFYFIKNHYCGFPWPYNRYCPLFSFLYRFFGYQPFPYFLLGIILSIFCSIIFYLFLKKLFSPKTSLWLALLLSSGYYSAENFFYAYSSITTFLSLSILLISLWFLLASKGKSIAYLTSGILFFYLSLAIFPPRASTYLILFLATTIIFLKSNLKRSHFYLILLSALIIFLKIFIFNAHQATGNYFQIWSRASSPDLTADYFSSHLQYFILTIGSLFITTFISNALAPLIAAMLLQSIKLVIGSLICLLYIIFLIKHRKKTNLLKTGFFACIWILSQYLPLGLVTEWGLESTNRYFIFPYLGVIIALALPNLAKKENSHTWSFIISLLIIFNLLQANIFFSGHRQANINRRLFYQTLSKDTPAVPAGSIFYFDAPPGQIARELADFMRVGFSSSEVALAAKLNLKAKDITIINDSRVFRRILNSPDFDPDKLFTYYWGGNTLVNTTLSSRKLLLSRPTQTVSKINRSSQTKLINNPATNSWSGRTPAVTFKLPNFSPLLPAQITLSIKANPLTVPTPYAQDCIDCQLLSTAKINFYFDFLIQSRLLLRETTVKATSSDEYTVPENMIDNIYDTYWLGDRSWFEGKKPQIDFNFSKEVTLSGLIISAPNLAREPTEYQILTNGNIIPHSSEKSTNHVTIITFPQITTNSLTFRIIQANNDRPSISEVEFIPSGFTNFDLSELRQLQRHPAAVIQTKADGNLLEKHLTTGVEACLTWNAPNYGTGSLPFILKADGRLRSYQFILPTMGFSNPQFSLECLNYPLVITVASASINY